MRLGCGLLACVATLHACLGEEKGTCDAFERFLPSKVTKEDILRREGNAADDVDTCERPSRKFEGPVLGYVTPWNGRGYDVAVKHRRKLTHIAPVWFQVVPGSPPGLRGRHDVDHGWMEKLRQGNAQAPKIVPRFLFEGWSGEQYVDLLQSAPAEGSLARNIADILVLECKQQKLDGVLLEVWTQWWAWGLTKHPAAHKAIVAFVAQLSEALGRSGKLLAIAVPPTVPAQPQYPSFSSHDFRALKPYVDLFSVMTYDASSPQHPGPNAPLGWVKECMEGLDVEASYANKVLVGLNFYGNEYGSLGEGRAILGHEFLSLLQEHRTCQLEWDEDAAEHALTYHVDGREHQAFYPSEESLSARINLARSRGSGLAIWELGQGLESFMALL